MSSLSLLEAITNFGSLDYHGLPLVSMPGWTQEKFIGLISSDDLYLLAEMKLQQQVELHAQSLKEAEQKLHSLKEIGAQGYLDYHRASIEDSKRGAPAAKAK